VPCPHCNEKADIYSTFFEIKWDLIKYENNKPKTAMLCCPECGQLIPEHNKTWMMDNAFWYRYNPTAKPGLENDERRNKLLVDIEKFGYSKLSVEDRWYLNETSIDDDFEEKPTFFISSLYSPLGFYSWADAVSMWIESNTKRDKNILRTFYNTVLGITFSETNDEMDFKGLKSRCEIYSPDSSFDLPMDALFVTCGVDVQKDRLEAQVIASGENDEEWVIDYRVFYGDTSIIGNEKMMFGGSKTCWGNLAEYLNTMFIHATGHRLPIECTLIDCRYRSQYVYAFCKAFEHKSVFAVQGLDGWGKGFIQRPQKKNRFGVWVFDSMSDELKVKIYSQLRNNNPGPNYIHFSKTISYPSLYFKGLVIEELKTKRQGGTDVQYWENPPGGRNEPLDTYCYAKTALLALRPSASARKILLFNPNGKDILQEKPRNRVISKGI
jgi:phage terminase large subunit GpA-like protein